MTWKISQSEMDALVRRVMNDLTGRQESAPAKTEVPVKTEAPAAKSDEVVPDPVSRESELHLVEGLISLAVVQEYAPREPRRWIVSRKAVITPSARDELRHLGVELVVGAGSGNTESRRERPGCETSLLVVNHLPSGERFPIPLQNLLRSNKAEVVSLECIIKTTDRMASYLTEGIGHKSLVVTHYPGLASALANHRPGIRAMVVSTAEAWRLESALVAPNLLILDPARVMGWQAVEVVRGFLDHECFLPGELWKESVCESVKS